MIKVDLEGLTDVNAKNPILIVLRNMIIKLDYLALKKGEDVSKRLLHDT